MSRPLVSVIMPLHNAEPYVGEAVRSVLDQTFTDLELLVVNDGSTDRSGAVVQAINDPRVRLVHQENLGVSAALNKALSLAKGTYIARHDADDVSLPGRIERQVAFLEAHPGTVIMGTWAALIDGGGLAADTLHHPAGDAEIRLAMLFNTAFVSSSVMLRAAVLPQVGLFDATGAVFDDFDMWSRIMACGQAANLPEELVRYRIVPTGLTHTTGNAWERLREQRRRNLARCMPELSTDLRELALGMGLGHPMAHADDLVSLKRALDAYIGRLTTDGAQRAAMQRRAAKWLMSYRTLPHRTPLHRVADRLWKELRLALA